MKDLGQGKVRSGRRAFRPTMDGTLEPRLLLSRASVVAKAAQTNRITARSASRGQVSLIRDTDGEYYNVSVLGGGTVRAQAMSGGLVRLILSRTNPSTVVAINSVRPPNGHPASNGDSGDRLLHVGEIRVKTGKVSQILGYRTTDLVGPITITSPSTVSRIALFSLHRGAAINTAGDLDTLDIYSNGSISGGPGIEIGRDLNFLNVGGDLTIGDGSTFSTGRDIGLNRQPPKGTDPGGQGAVIQGNLNIDPDGSLVIGRAIQATFLIQGNFNVLGDFQLGETVSVNNLQVIGDINI